MPEGSEGGLAPRAPSGPAAEGREPASAAGSGAPPRLRGLDAAHASELERSRFARHPAIVCAVRRMRRRALREGGRYTRLELVAAWLAGCWHAFPAKVRERFPGMYAKARRSKHLRPRIRRAEAELLRGSALFDRDFYYQENPDIAAAGLDPVEHYLEHGAYEGRKPHALFEVEEYIRDQPGLKESGTPALVHYLRRGKLEEIDPFVLFDATWYLDGNPEAEASSLTPLEHYLTIGWKGSASPHPLIDPEFYRRRYPHLARLTMPAMVHFYRYGLQQTLDPHPCFDTSYYVGLYPDVASSGLNPLVHYLRWGAREGRDPSPMFDTGAYVAANPGIVHTGITNPLVHFVLRGAGDGLSPCAMPAVPRDPRSQRRHGLRLRPGRPKVLIVLPDAADTPLTRLMLAVVEHFALDRSMDCIVVAGEDGPLHAALEIHASVLVESYFGAGSPTHGGALDQVPLEGVRFALVASATAIPFLNATAKHDLTAVAFLLDPLADVDEDRRRILVRYAERVVFRSQEALEAARAVEPLVAEKGWVLESAAEGPLVREGPPLDAWLARLGDLLTGALKLDLPPVRLDAVAVDTAATPRVIFTMPLWNISGVNTFTEALMKELISKGFEVELLFTSNDIRRDALPPVPCTFLDEVLPGPDRPFSGDRWNRIVQYLARRAPCIFVPGYDFFASAVCAALPDDVGVLGVVHSDDFEHYEHALRLGRYWNAVVAVSKCSYRNMLSLVPALRPIAHYIPYGIELPPPVERPLREPGEPLRIVWTGRLEQVQKNVQDIPPIVRALEASGLPYVLTLVGDGSQEESLREQMRAELEAGRVRMPGRCNQAEVRRALHEADVFLLVSLFEGLPLSLLEAMACGCVPVVGDIESGIPELVVNGETGFRVPLHQPDAFVRRLRELALDPAALQAMSRRSAALIAERYSARQMADDYAEVLREIWRELRHAIYRRPWSPAPVTEIGPILLPPWFTRDPASLK